MNTKVMDKKAVKLWFRALRLIAAVGFAVGAHAAPPPGHSPRAVPEEIILRGTDAEGNELALRVPVNILLDPSGSGLAQLQQPGNNANINLNQIGGGSVSSTLYDSGNNALKVNCIVGCSAAVSFTDNGAFTTGSTSVTNVSGLFNDTATNLTSGNAGAIRATTDRMLFVNIGKIGGTAPTLTGSSLNVNCTGGCAAGASFIDNNAFTAGTTSVTNIGGVFNDGLSAVTSGNAAAPRITNNRGLHVNLRNASGTEIATSANPLFANVSQWAGGTLGAMANYGTSPGAVLVPGVNASITNTPTVAGAFNTASGNITTTGGSNLAVTFTGMGCVGIVVSGAWTGNLAVQQSNDGVNWQPADTLQQLLGKWVESIGNNGRFYTGGFSAQQVRLNGPVTTGTATVSMQTSQNACEEYVFAIPGTEIGNGFFGQPVSATATQTSIADSIQGHKEAELAVTWSGVTGSPSGCQIQPQGSADGVNFINSGPPLPVQPGTNALLTAPGPLLIAAKFIYSCGTYPGAGTITLGILYKLGGQTLVGGSIPEISAGWTSGTAQNTTLTQVVGGYGSLNVYLNQGTTMTGGVVTFEGSDTAAFTNAYPVSCTIQNTYVPSSTYTLVASTNAAFVCPINNYTAFRVRLSTVISGTATVNVGISTSALTNQPAVAIGNNPTVFGLDNITQFGSNNVVTGTGASGVGIPRVTVSNDSQVRLLGNAGGIMDAGGQNAASPANELLSACQFNSAPTTITTGNVSPTQCDSKGQTKSAIYDAAGNNRGANVTAGNAVQADLTSVAGTAAVTDGTAGVQAVGGHFANNATAAATNKAPVMIGIAQTSYANGTAYTQGRDVVPDVFTDGALHVATLPAMRPASYVASAAFAGSSTTDNAVMPGNASNTVLVTRVKVSCTQTTAGVLTLTLIKRSAADTAGTSAAMTAVPEDSNYGAAVSAPLSYTGTGPTAGTAVGNVDSYKLGCIAPGTATSNDKYIGDFTQKPIVLRGTAQQLAVNFGNAAITGGNIAVTFEWIETATILP